MKGFYVMGLQAHLNKSLYVNDSSARESSMKIRHGSSRSYNTENDDKTQTCRIKRLNSLEERRSGYDNLGFFMRIINTSIRVIDYSLRELASAKRRG